MSTILVSSGNPEENQRKREFDSSDEESKCSNFSFSSSIDDFLISGIYHVPNFVSNRFKRRLYRCSKCFDYYPALKKFAYEHFRTCDYISFYLKTPHIEKPSQIPCVWDKICGLCGYSTDKISSIKAHFSSEHIISEGTDITLFHEKSRDKCHLCKMKIPNLNALYHHTIIHKLKYKYTSFECDTTERPQINCELCNDFKSFTEIKFYDSFYINHLRNSHSMKIDLEFICQLCGHLDTSIDSVSLHLIENHQVPDMSSLERFEQRIEKCHLCTKPFYSFVKGMYKHFEDKHERELIHFALNRCPICEEFLSNRKLIELHLKKVHFYKRMFICPICKLDKLPTRVEAIKHIKIHHARPFNELMITKGTFDNIKLKDLLFGSKN